MPTTNTYYYKLIAKSMNIKTISTTFINVIRLSTLKAIHIVIANLLAIIPDSFHLLNIFAKGLTRMLDNKYPVISWALSA